MKLSLVLAVGSLFVSAVFPSRAGAVGSTIIGNLNGNDGTSSVNLSNLRNKGMGFTIPAGPGYKLDSVTLRLDGGTTIQPVVQLWSNSGVGLPNQPILTLTNPAFVDVGIVNHTFTPSIEFILQAANTYWLVVSGSAGGSTFSWMANSPGIVPVGIANHFGQFFDADGPPPTGASTALNSYQILGTLVPEPGSLLLIAMAAMASIAFRKRRSARLPA